MSGISALFASLLTLRRQGFSYWRAENFPSRAGKLIEVSFRGGPSLTVRARDSDLAVLRQVFVDRHYHVWVDALRERIQRRYEAILADDAVPVIIDAGQISEPPRSGSRICIPRRQSSPWNPNQRAPNCYAGT